MRSRDRFDNPVAALNLVRDRRQQLELLQVRSERVRRAELSHQSTMLERHVRFTQRSVNSAQVRLERRFGRLLQQSEIQLERANASKSADPKLLTELSTLTTSPGPKISKMISKSTSIIQQSRYYSNADAIGSFPLSNEPSSAFVTTLRRFWNLPSDVRLRALSDAALHSSGSGIGNANRHTGTNLIHSPQERAKTIAEARPSLARFRREASRAYPYFSLPPVEPSARRQSSALVRDATLCTRKPVGEQNMRESSEREDSRLDSEAEQQTEDDGSADNLFERLRALSVHARPESPLFPRTPPSESAQRPSAPDERARKVDAYTRFINDYMSSTSKFNTFAGTSENMYEYSV